MLELRTETRSVIERRYCLFAGPIKPRIASYT